MSPLESWTPWPLAASRAPSIAVFARPNFYKSAEEIRLMVEPGLATAAALDAARKTIAVGATTLDVDAAAERAIVMHGGASNFKLVPGYRHTVCASVNDDVSE